MTCSRTQQTCSTFVALSHETAAWEVRGCICGPRVRERTIWAESALEVHVLQLSSQCPSSARAAACSFAAALSETHESY